MTTLNFTKMHGTGNDFIIIDNRERLLSDGDIISLAPKLCNRHFGIGADGIIALHRPENPALDYTMFYRNADGSDAGMCGNGARCLALYAARAGLGTKLSFNVHDTIYEAAVNQTEAYVTVSFPMPVDIKQIALQHEAPIYQLYTGTEHIVLEAAESLFEDDKQLGIKGKKLRNAPRFNPPGTNVNFIKGIASTEIGLKTYEKGVEGLTLACGTGAIAAALSWHQLDEKDSSEDSITVQTDGGTLTVDFNYDPAEKTYGNITLSGSAHTVFEGRYEI